LLLHVHIAEAGFRQSEAICWDGTKRPNRKREHVLGGIVQHVAKKSATTKGETVFSGQYCCTANKQLTAKVMWQVMRQILVDYGFAQAHGTIVFWTREIWESMNGERLKFRRTRRKEVQQTKSFVNSCGVRHTRRQNLRRI
jgi:hypothetical protein